MKHKMASVLAFWQSSKSNHLMLSSIETTAGSSRDTLKQSSKVAAIFVDMKPLQCANFARTSSKTWVPFSVRLALGKYCHVSDDACRRCKQ